MFVLQYVAGYRRQGFPEDWSLGSRWIPSMQAGEEAYIGAGSAVERMIPGNIAPGVTAKLIG